MATNDSGPLRHRYGSMRDLVVGMTVVLSRRHARAVGRQGDQERRRLRPGASCSAGSFGTLGLIVAVAVRLHPLPPGDRERGRRAATTRSGSARAARALAAHAARGRLPRRRLARRRRAPAGALRRRRRGRAGARRRVARMRELGLDDCDVVEDDDELWMDAARAPARRLRAQGLGPRHRPAGGLPRAAARRRRPRRRSGSLALAAGATRRRSRPRGEALAPRACTLLDAPAELRADAWAAPDPGALAVMARVKERFDPARIFRPGTFVGGI